MLKQTKIFETENPDVFIKSKSDEDIEKQLTTIKDTMVSYSVWRKVFVEKKLKNGQTKQIRKMKVIEEKSSRAEFISSFKNEIKSFQQHVRRVNIRYSQQRFLKEHLKCGQVAIHMDFSEDYNCRSQDEVQSAYWNNISVTLHPVVVYYRNNLDEDLTVKSYVIVSNESRHDARFVHSTMEKMAIENKNFVPQVTFYHYFTDSPTSQYRNKSIFKIISCHEDYFGAPAAWNYSEAGHGKGPCDPIGGTAKRKAAHAVKHGKASTQDAHDLFAWSLNDGEQSKVTYLFLSTEDYDRSEGFLTSACKNFSPIQGTMEIHAVIGIGRNKVYVRNTSCYCINCFLSAFKKSTVVMDGGRLTWEGTMRKKQRRKIAMRNYLPTQLEFQ